MKHDLDYMIAVMTAAKYGKKIEYYNHIKNELYDCNSLDCNCGVSDYSIKPEEHKLEYVPYESVDEFLQAQKKHGMHIRPSYAPYINADNHIALISEERIAITDFECMLHNYVWDDGTPCGKLKQ